MKKHNFFNKMWFIWQPITNTTNKSTQKGKKYLFLQSESKLGRRNQISPSSFWFFKPTVAGGVGMALLPLPLCEGLERDTLILWCSIKHKIESYLGLGSSTGLGSEFVHSRNMYTSKKIILCLNSVRNKASGSVWLDMLSVSFPIDTWTVLL